MTARDPLLVRLTAAGIDLSMAGFGDDLRCYAGARSVRASGADPREAATLLAERLESLARDIRAALAPEAK